MKNIFKTLTVLVFSVVLVGTAFGQTRPVVANQPLTMATLEGDKYALADDKGKVVVFAIGASWLPLSRNQAMITGKLQKRYATKNVVIYFVATDSTNAKSKNFATAEQIKSFATRAKLTAPILRDSDGAATLKRFGIDQIPAFVVIDKEGKLATEAFGGLTPGSEDDMVGQISGVVDNLLK